MRLLEFRKNFFGPRPSFVEADLYRALWIVCESQVDRKTLARRLQLGEGSARTILRQLVSAGLVEVRKRGALLSRNGDAFFSRLSADVLAAKKIEESDYTLGQEAFAIVLAGAAGVVRAGIEERDAAVREGASGATVIVCRQGKLVFPDSGFALPEAHSGFFAGRLGALPEGAAVILAFGSNASCRERGCWAAALEVMRKQAKRA